MKMKFKTCLLLISSLLLIHKTNAQCPSPTSVSVTTANITCRNSGEINVANVKDGTNNIPLANCNYALFDAANVTIVRPQQSSPIFSSLDAGTYTLHVWQVCTSPSGLSAHFTKTVSITGSYTEPLMGTITTTDAYACGTGGTITVNDVTKGYGAYSYSLVDSMTAPVTPTHYVVAPQPSNVFTGLAAGTYFVRVYDQCTGYYTTQAIVGTQSAPMLVNVTMSRTNDCSSFILTGNFTTAFTADNSNPLWVKYPDGTIDTPANSGPYTFKNITIPFSRIGAYPATFTVGYKNPCGVISTAAYTVNRPALYMNPQLASNVYDCDYNSYNPASVIVRDSNNDYVSNNIIPSVYSLDSGKTWKPYNSSDVSLIRNGDSISVQYNVCGEIMSAVWITPKEYPLSISPFEHSKESCDGKAGIRFSIDNARLIDKIQFHVVSAPASQPAIADFNADKAGLYLQLANLVPGTYTFSVSDQCSGDTTFSINITGKGVSVLSTSIEEPACSPYVNIVVKDSVTKAGTFSATNFTLLNSNGDEIASSSTFGSELRMVTFMNVLPGKYYIKSYNMATYGAAPVDSSCSFQTITVTAARTPLSIDRSLFAICTNETSLGTIIAVPSGGSAPYLYSVYKDVVSAGTLVSGPQTNNVFKDLAPNTVYIIAVTDQCGSGTTARGTLSNLRVPVSLSTTITPCEGAPISISVFDIPGLSYSWTKNNEPIPGATNSAFTINNISQADSGLYVTNISSGSCVLLSNPVQLDPSKCGSPIPLAIDMVSFSGKLNAASNAVLYWTIAKPEPGAKFEVLYSTDGIKFTSAGMVYEDGATTTFSFTHQNYTITQKTFYKLLMTEADGKKKYSTTLALQADKNATINTTLTAAPIPFSSSINISYISTTDMAATLSLTDMQGRVLKTQAINVVDGSNSFSMYGLETLANGIYLLSIQDNNKKVKETIKIQK